MAQPANVETRPSPEALLQQAARDQAGRLKIFLGAAPGVGKTYEMLLAGQRRRRDGTDVVVGVVETHGRAETAALLDGLEIVPRRTVVYEGHQLEEMDLEAILARRPSLVLVDELAHSNAPGSRHPKRHLDVEDLLAAGIDVYTTINIQHVESLNDAVAQITRVRVREIVPDAVIERADEIELIDITPGDLIARLKEGKVYVPQQARNALENYFSPGNLTALRELALRRTAERVDEQLRTHMQAHAVAGPWPASEHLLVCVSEDPRSPALVRYTKRMADRLHAGWTAVSVETARTRRLDAGARQRIDETLRAAERLGARAATLPGSGSIATDLLAFARQMNVTQIVIGKSTRSRWFEVLHGSVVHDLVRRAGAISVHVIAGEETSAPPTDETSTPEARSASPWPWLAAVAAVAGALAIGKLVQPLLGIETIDLIFIAAVLAVALRFGLTPSLFASLLASACYNFFFLPPTGTFTITDPTNVAAFLFFLVMAVGASNLAARVRAEVIAARRHARATEALYGYARKIVGVSTLDDLLLAALHQIASMLKLDVVLLLPENGVLTLKAAWPPEDILDEADLGAATWAFDRNRPAGRGSDTLTGARRLFLPIGTARGALGVIGLTRASGTPLLSPDERRLFEALSDQTAVAIERIMLERTGDEARIAAETERLRSALLASLSHDLKTPLAAITGAASSLRQYDSLLAAEDRRDLAGTIESEANRLARFVANLLDMARLSSGPIELRSEPVDIGEVVGTALQRCADIIGVRRVAIEDPDDVPMLRLDPVLFEQVLVNLIDNGARYSPPDAPLAIRCARRGDTVEIAVLDEGPGIPETQLERVFERFHRVPTAERRAGSGLGLAIARGFVEALGGAIHATNRADRPGAAIIVRFPLALAVPPADFAQ